MLRQLFIERLELCITVSLASTCTLLVLLVGRLRLRCSRTWVVLRLLFFWYIYLI